MSYGCASAAGTRDLLLLPCMFLFKGFFHLYAGYSATLLRNMPSAVLRFTVFEDLKLRLGELLALVVVVCLANGCLSGLSSGCDTSTPEGRARLLFAGSASGLLASGLTTPMDVLKTKFASGALNRNLGIIRGVRKVVAAEGAAGLFVGFHGRVLWSMLFSAIGFTSFEIAKDALGVGDPKNSSPSLSKQRGLGPSGQSAGSPEEQKLELA